MKVKDLIVLPNCIQVGGQVLVTEIKSDLDGKLGVCCVAEGKICIAETFNGKTQSETSKFNTYIHELTHSILDTLGRDDLSKDEVFVSSFSSVLTEAIRSIEYELPNQRKERT